MNKIIIVTLIALISTISLFGQTAIPKIPNQVEAHDRLTMKNDEKTPSVSIYIADNIKATSKAWKKKLNDKYQLKIKKKKGWSYCESCNLLPLSNNTISIYYRISEEGKGSRLSLIVKNASGEYIDSTDQTGVNQKSKTFLEKFANERYLIIVNKALAEQVKVSKSLNSDKVSLEKEKTSIEKDIAEEESDVVDLKNKISKTQLKINELQAKLKEQETDLSGREKKIDADKKQKETINQNLEAKKQAIEIQNQKVEQLQMTKERVSPAVPE